MKKVSLACLPLILFSIAAFSQNQIGGHFGFVHPLVTFTENQTTSIFDSYVVGFPIGITVRKSEKFAFDAEFVPFVSENNNVTLLVHPGFLFGLGKKWTFGTRAAFEINQNSYGFTPLFNKGFKIGNTPVFAEFVLPVRFGDFTSVTMGLHLGVGF